MRQLIYIMEAERFWYKKGGATGYRLNQNWDRYDPEAVKRTVGRFEVLPDHMGAMAPCFGVTKVAYGRNFGSNHFRKGYLIFGPVSKVKYPPYYMHGINRLGVGNYLATFTFYIDVRGVAPNQLMAILECSDDKGRQVLARKEITPNYIQRLKLSNPHSAVQLLKIDLPVRIPNIVHHLETRIFWTGAGLIKFGNISFFRIIR